MEIFGIGPLELLFIILIALVVLGPKEMMGTAKKSAEWLKKLRQSDVWKSTKEVMDIPNQVLQDSGLDKELRELQNVSKGGIGGSVWNPSTLPSINPTAAAGPEKEKVENVSPEGVTPPDQTTTSEQPPLENDK
jgi:Sec-independent protein translocase protein TatA